MAEVHYLCTILLLSLSVSGVAFPATITFVNNCTYPVWPGVKSNAATAELSTTGLALNSGESFNFSVDAPLSGLVWGAGTLCSHNSSTGKVECAGGGAAPRATVAEFTLKGADGFYFYNVRLVGVYNLSMLVAPQGGGNCTITGCAADLNVTCSRELKLVITGDTGGDRGSNKGGDDRNNTGSDNKGDGDISGQLVACQSSACDVFGTPDACKPSMYPELFKNVCPLAHNYVYHNSTITFTCPAADHVMITFCPIGH